MRGPSRGGGRPPIRKVASARIRGRVGPSKGAGPIRPEGIRYLRADGTPNWEQWREIKEGDAKRLASSPAITISTSGNILEAAEAIAKHKVRGLPVVKAGSEEIAGVVTALDLVNYLGGGEYYKIVELRHKRNIYSALRDENIMSIANPTPTVGYVTDKLSDIVNLMILSGHGFIPILWPDNTVYGVITEHDIVKHLAGTFTGVKVGEVATKSIVSVEIEATIKDAARIMVSQGFRRLPVVDPVEGIIKGMITAKDIVSYFGSHEAFKHITTTDIEEALKTPVYELMQPGIYTIRFDVDVGQAASHMIEMNVNALLVVDENDQIIGIVTERDILEAFLR